LTEECRFDCGRSTQPGGRSWAARWAPQTPQIGKISTAKRSIDIRTPGKLRPARLGGGYAGESSADAERPAQEEAATEIDEIIVTGQRDYLYRADQSDALGTSIPLAELPAIVNVITEDFP
jgi:outer membrane receptor for monomeric catechols